MCLLQCIVECDGVWMGNRVAGTTANAVDCGMVMVRRAQSIEKGVYRSSKVSLVVQVGATVGRPEIVMRGPVRLEMVESMSTLVLLRLQLNLG